MRKYRNKLFLIAIAIILMFSGQISVRAECYKSCVDKSCEYVYDYPEFGVCWSYLDAFVVSVDGEEPVYRFQNFYEWGNSNSSKNCPNGEADGCLILSEDECLNNLKISVNAVDDSFCSSSGNYDEGVLLSCGNNLIKDIPKMIPRVVHIVYLGLLIVVPILIVLFGSIDFVKAVIAQKDDEIKNGQRVFIKRLIIGILVFFVFAIVKLVVNFVDSDSDRGIKNVMKCVDCFINYNESCVSQSS